MTGLWLRHFEKVLLAAALGLGAISLAWTGSQSADAKAAPTGQRKSVPAVPDFWMTAEGDEQCGVCEWMSPVEQARGAGWVFELFTPPAIRREGPGGRLAVDLPGDEASAAWELVSVSREPFRLQLVGYFGAAGDLTATFVCPGSGGTVLARAGQRLDQLGFVLLRMERRGAGAGPLAGAVEIDAVLKDERAGREVTLPCGRLVLTDVRVARVRAVRDPPRSFDLREGSSWLDDGGEYRVERISIDPPEVTLIKASESAGGRVRSRIRLRQADAAPSGLPAGSGPAPAPPARATTSRGSVGSNFT